jgi:shikimate dehydrogenase
MQDGKLFGDNTDGQGLVAAIQALGWNLKNSRILILGAGGATRGVIYPCTSRRKNCHCQSYTCSS